MSRSDCGWNWLQPIDRSKKGVVWLVLDAGILVDEYDPNEANITAGTARRCNIYINPVQAQTISEFFTEFTAAKYSEDYKTIRKLCDDFAIIDASIPFTKRIHGPMEVGKLFRQTCGARKFGVATKASGGIAGFKTIECNKLIETCTSLEFIRNTHSHLTPIK